MIQRVYSIIKTDEAADRAIGLRNLSMKLMHFEREVICTLLWHATQKCY